jgi:hypothetical protein
MKTKEIEAEEFRLFLLHLRLKVDHIRKIEKWFIEKGFIQRYTGSAHGHRCDMIVFVSSSVSSQ